MRNSQGFFGYFCFKAVGIRFPVKGKIFVILKFFFLAGKFLWTGWRHLIFWVFRFLTDFFIHFYCNNYITIFSKTQLFMAQLVGCRPSAAQSPSVPPALASQPLQPWRRFFFRIFHFHCRKSNFFSNIYVYKTMEKYL